MKITLDHSKSQAISEIIHTHPGHGDWNPSVYHLSDALYCSVNPYCRMTAVKAVVNRRLAAIWAIGRTAHVILEENFENKEKEFVFDDDRLSHPCHAHLDVVFLNEPIEFKSTRQSIHSFRDIPSKWVKQIKYECVFSESSIGWLAILNLVTTTVTVWKIVFTQQELVDARMEYINKIAPIQLAVETKNPFILDPAREECLTCVYSEGCPRRPGI